MLITEDFWSTINVASIFVIATVFANTKGEIIHIVFHWLGKYSLELYILHLLVYNFLNRIDNHYGDGIHIVIGVVIALLICQPIHFVIDKVIYHEYKTR